MPTLTHAESAIATAHIADACLRLDIPFRIAPAGIKPLLPTEGMVYGPAIPVRHYGSVDVFLEVLETLESPPENGILVIDNGGRQDEACIGDLVVLEVQKAKLGGIVLWGLHRDTSELLRIGLPVFSYGSCPTGPRRLDPREPDAMRSARFCEFMVTRTDMVLADADGVIFIEAARFEQILDAARSIQEREKRQVEAALQGKSLREQFQFRAYLQQRDLDAEYTFRKHLNAISKSIEE